MDSNYYHFKGLEGFEPSTLFRKKALQKLTLHYPYLEKVKLRMEAIYKSSYGFLIVTDERLIFSGANTKKEILFDLPFERILNVNLSIPTDLPLYTIFVDTSKEQFVFNVDNLRKSDFFVKFLEDAINSAFNFYYPR